MEKFLKKPHKSSTKFDGHSEEKYHLPKSTINPNKSSFGFFDNELF
jgi:hypothetical protein